MNNRIVKVKEKLKVRVSMTRIKTGGTLWLVCLRYTAHSDASRDRYRNTWISLN